MNYIRSVCVGICLFFTNSHKNWWRDGTGAKEERIRLWWLAGSGSRYGSFFKDFTAPCGLQGCKN